jgi:hypothetical protein
MDTLSQSQIAAILKVRSELLRFITTRIIGLQEDPLVGICCECPIHHQYILREVVCYRLCRVFGAILQACGVGSANWHHPVGSLGGSYSLVPMPLARNMELR